MDRHNEHNLTGQPGYGWDMTDKPFLTIREVADLLQVSNRTVYNLIYNGTLRACRLTYHITLITREDFFLIRKQPTASGAYQSSQGRRKRLKRRKWTVTDRT